MSQDVYNTILGSGVASQRRQQDTDSVRQPMVPLLIGDIKNRQEDIYKSLGLLAGRLSPVSVARDNCAVKDPSIKDAPTPSKPEMVLRLEEILRSTHQIDSLIRALIDNLEI